MSGKTDSKIKTAFLSLTRSTLALPALVFVVYFVLSLGIAGPAYMTDEIGYLNKASVLTGHSVHMSTSWFGGYSVLISPAFLLSSNPYTIWTLVLLLNAIMWAASAWLLLYILKKTHPKASSQYIWLAALAAMLYPSWLSMSGYAFATSGFVLVFMASLAALLKSDLKNHGWLALSGLLAGYLCWIHPLGLLYLALYLGILLVSGILQKNWMKPIIAIGSAAFALTYIVAVHPWFTIAMGGSVVNDAHYTSGVTGILTSIFTQAYWLRAFGLVVGLVFFVLVASFGLAVYGAFDVFKSIKPKLKNWRELLLDTKLVVMSLPVLLIIGVILFTALSWANTSQLRMDQWVYGRYTDMYLLPLLAFGLLSVWKLKQGTLIAAFALGGGLVLSVLTNPSNTNFAFNNKVNIQGLWPMQIASVIHANQYWFWGVLGALGIFYVALVGSKQKKALLTLLLVPIVLTAAGNYIYNLTITRQHATVSTLYQYIKTNYSQADCIGFTPQQDNFERFNLYTYYLQGYNIKRIPLDQWEQENCTGPYLTYDKQIATAPGLKIVGYEQKTGLMVVTKQPSSVAERSNSLIFGKDLVFN